jgi:peptide chain release factor 1
MKPSIAAKLASLDARLKEIDSRLADPDVVKDLDNFRKLSQERAEIEPVVRTFSDYRSAEGDVAAAEEMARDPETRDFAEQEIKAGRERMVALEAELQRMLLPRDPNDDKNLFLEIRAGTGGDESALFAGDLFRMYSRFAERNRWQVEIVSESPGEAGGYRKSSRGSSATARTRSSSSNRAAIACSAFPRPRRRDASILQPRPWR